MPKCECGHKAISHAYVNGTNSGPCLALNCEGCNEFTDSSGD